VKEFLDQFTDYELSIFYHFRRFEFLKESQELIRNALKLREVEISETPMNLDFIEITSDQNCQRCNSRNFERISENELRSTSVGGYEVTINSYKCRVCGFNPDKNVSLSFGMRLKKLFGKYNWIKLK